MTEFRERAEHCSLTRLIWKCLIYDWREEGESSRCFSLTWLVSVAGVVWSQVPLICCLCWCFKSTTWWKYIFYCILSVFKILRWWRFLPERGGDSSSIAVCNATDTEKVWLKQDLNQELYSHGKIFAVFWTGKLKDMLWDTWLFIFD